MKEAEQAALNKQGSAAIPSSPHVFVLSGGAQRSLRGA